MNSNQEDQLLPSPKIDGAELTAPSIEGELIAKPELLSAPDTSRPLVDVTSKKQQDIFSDLHALARTRDQVIPSERVLTVLPVRKPKKDEWVRCHPEIATPINIYESSTDREIFLILPELLDVLDDVARHVRMTLTVTYSGEAFIWPVPIPTERRAYPAHVSSAAAAEAAIKSWIRIAWKGSDYEVTRRRENSKPPAWPEEIPDASEMLRFACKAGGIEVIGTPEHPVVQSLLGLS